MSKFTQFLSNESGASAAEYVLILAIVGTGIVGAVTVLGTSISSAMNRAATAINGVTYTP